MYSKLPTEIFFGSSDCLLVVKLSFLVPPNCQQICAAGRAFSPSGTASVIFFNKLFTLGCCYFQLGNMAVGFVKSTVD